MRLNNLFLINERQPVNIAVHGEKIMAISSENSLDETDPFQLFFSNAIAIPGLINSHDHLDFNCFPVYSEKIYSNYTEWGRHIHEEFRVQIEGILKIPQYLRAAWGMYKNLLAGVTTVVNHGIFLRIQNPLIHIYQESQNIHSVHFEKNWKWKLNNPLYKTKDCVIHTGEGRDEQSSVEIDKLTRYNFLKRNLVGVHGVAMNDAQARNFKALIWCPESNRVLLNRHAPIARLKKSTRIVFGTDSTLTGNWNIWKHLRLAKSLKVVSDAELFEMVTSSAAELWNLNKGMLQVKKDADIVIIRKRDEGPTWNEVFKTNPEDILLITQQGHIRLFDKSLLGQFNTLPIDLYRFSQVNLNGIVKFVEGDLPGLISAIQDYHPTVHFPVGVFESLIYSAYD
jgi:cytosine/adenosine deaminase-related metal-dependent hydrolase